MNTHVRREPAAFDLTPAEATSGWLTPAPSSLVRTGGGFGGTYENLSRRGFLRGAAEFR
jgi:hypothetical protein